MPDDQPAARPRGNGMVAPDDPRAVVWQVIRGPWRFAAVYAFTRLGCADHLAGGLLSTDELARRCGAGPGPLERILRCAASLGLLAQPAPGRYALTQAGRSLCGGVSGSMRAAVLATGESAGWQALLGLDVTALTGEPAFAARHGRGFYDHLAAHPDRAAVFGEFMASRSADVAAALAALDFGGDRVVADIGGGSGMVLAAILAAILAAHPHLRGLLVDRPHVLDQPRSHLSTGSGTEGPGAGTSGPGSRMELVPGDYLAGPLPSAGTYVLASILHNHDDAEARVILGNVRAAAVPGRPRILLADILLPDRPVAHVGVDLDIRMMALGTGRERTLATYLALLTDAGLTGRVIAAPYGLSIIEAQPAGTDTGPWSTGPVRPEGPAGGGGGEAADPVVPAPRCATPPRRRGRDG
jgi:hypothetical protein